MDRVELNRLAQSDDVSERRAAVDWISQNIEIFPKKEHKWKILHRLSRECDGYIMLGITEILRSNFSQHPKKEQAWADLIRFAGDNNNYLRYSAEEALASVFPHHPDKELAWDDLVQLIEYRNMVFFRKKTDIFMEEMIRLSKPKLSPPQCSEVDMLGRVFAHVPDKKKAWDDLHRLIQHSDIIIR